MYETSSTKPSGIRLELWESTWKEPEVMRNEFETANKTETEQKTPAGKFSASVGALQFTWKAFEFRLKFSLNCIRKLPLNYLNRPLFIAAKMVFACQKDSFQRTLTAKVKSCYKIKDENFYEVICEDSILFPEGGGQPWDTGYLNEARVHKVVRRGQEAVMLVDQAFLPGDTVQQVLDWDRRLDHMQQHSGQHLITAVINKNYGIDTTSWWLGEKVCHIELDTKFLSHDQVLYIEKLTNEKVFEQLPVLVKLYEMGDENIANARTRGIPSDVTGPLRVVEIVGMEDDLCCGTHVSNLGQLQCIKLLHAEKGKKDRTNLYFLSGGRVLQYLSDCLQRELKLTKILKNEPASHAELVLKLQNNMRSSKKKLSAALKELGTFEAKEFQTRKPKPKYFCRFNKDGDSEYMDSFLRTISTNENNTFFVLATGDEKGSGNLIILGQEKDVAELGPRIAEMLEGKGAIHGNKFKGKISNLTNFSKVESVVRAHFEVTS